MDVKDLKEYIIEKDLTIKILESLGCHKIKQNSNDIRCALPNKENSTSVSIRPDTLNTNVRSSEHDVSGDIVTLVMLIKDCKFISALKWLHGACNLTFTGKPTPKKEDNKNDPLALFKSIRCNDNGCYQSRDMKIYDESMLSSYIVMPHIELFKEGISIKSQKKFDVSYCPRSKRIVFPYKYHGGHDNSYLGASGRTVIEDYSILDIPKYMAMPPFAKGNTLFGMVENYEHIQNSGMVVVVEGEKSVMKIDTFGHMNAVSIGSHSITHEQRRLLLSLNVEVVIAYDHDIGEEEIIEDCKRFSKYQVVSYIFDKEDLLEGKDSPCDKGIGVYERLLNGRTKIK